MLLRDILSRTLCRQVYTSSMLMLSCFVNLWCGTLGREDIIRFTVTTSFPLHANPLPAAGFLAPAREDRLPETEIDLRSEEHTSELQSPNHLVSRLLLEKK